MTAGGDLPGEDSTKLAISELGNGRYVIQESIGQGGMGEVYRALDRQLDRMVAVKAIHPGLASKPNVVRRLAREARSAASIDHPFICKVHELIHLDDGQAFLVMEYVEGETLKAVLKKGRIDLGQAVRIAREISEALSFAHQRGLVHRDIKPSNVMITAHHHVKVMDFGLAKVGSELSVPTTTTLTDPGHIVGTPAYMSPEQARGEMVDHRSDIFSFGVLLYECLTGRLPFEGPRTAAYLREAATAAPAPMPKGVPAELRTLVQRCLEKAPEQRPQDFDAVCQVLDTAALSLSASSAFTLSQRFRLGPLPWVAATIVAVAAVISYLAINYWRTDEGSVGHVLVQRPVVTWPSVEEGSRVSPDGNVVSFISTHEGGPRLWIRSVEGTEPKPLTAAREAIKTPAWSPDGRHIAYLFRNDGRAWLEIVSTWGEADGPARPIGDAWNDVALVRWIGSRIYFSVSSGRTASVLWRISRSGTDATRVTHESGKSFTTSGPTIDIDIRHDERRVVFVASPEGGVWGGLWTADLDGRNAQPLPVKADRVWTPRWRGADGRRIVYVTYENGQADVWEYLLESGTRSALTTSPLEEEAIDVSASGNVLVADTIEQVSHLWSVDPATASGAVQLTNDSRSDLWPSVSSASSRVIFHRRQGAFVEYTPRDTEVLMARWTDRRLAQSEVVGPGTAGGISADGRRVFFLQWKGAEAQLWVKDLDKPGPGRKLWDLFWFPGNHIGTWAPLGQTAIWPPNGSDDLFFVRRVAPGVQAFEIVRATLAADLSATIRVLASERGEQRFSDPWLSDDGSTLAFVTADRRPYRGGTVNLLPLTNPASRQKAAFESAEGAQLYVRGWTKRGTLVVLKSLRPDQGNATEVWEVDALGRSKRVATVPGLLGMTARLDPARDRLYATGIEQGHSTVRAVSLADGDTTTIVPNAVDGITFGGYAVTADGTLLYMRKDTKHDVWIFNVADRRSGSASQAGQR